MSDQGFYVVWNPQGGSPRFRHDTSSSAQAEAERLAGQSPGQHFYVLAAVSVSCRNNITTLPLRLPDALPF